MNATADLHAIWLDDLAPGEGATNPLWDETFANTDDETRVYLRALMAGGPVEPVSEPAPALRMPTLTQQQLRILAGRLPRTTLRRPSGLEPLDTPKRKKPAKPKSPLAAQEAKLRTVRGRLADEFKTLGGEGGEVNELGVAFACLLGLLLEPVLIAVFG